MTKFGRHFFWTLLFMYVGSMIRRANEAEKIFVCIYLSPEYTIYIAVCIKSHLFDAKLPWYVAHPIITNREISNLIGKGYCVTGLNVIKLKKKNEQNCLLYLNIHVQQQTVILSRFNSTTNKQMIYQVHQQNTCQFDRITKANTYLVNTLKPQ